MPSINKIIKKTKNPKIRDFLAFSNFILNNYGFRVRLIKKKLLSLSRTDGNNKSTGYFCSSNKEIAVAIDRPIEKWFGSVYVHEFAHFIQWLNKTSASKQCEKERSLEKIYDWIDRKIELSPRDLRHHFSLVKKMEWECEMIAVKLIKIFDLPIDIDWYIRGAKKYIKVYDYSRKHRRWKIIEW